MGTSTTSNVLQFLTFGILSILFLQLCTFQPSQAATTAEIDLYRRQKPVQQVADVYADAAKFNVDIPNPIGARFLKCGERGTHVVQLALSSNPSNYSFAYNVSQRSDGFTVGNLSPNTGYVVRVACRFNEGSPGEWSDPSYITTREWSGKESGGGHHHHHHHDGQDGGGGSSGSQKSSGGDGKSHGSPKYEMLDLPIPSALTADRPSNLSTTTESDSLVDQTTGASPATASQQQFYGVLGEWANLTCIANLVAQDNRQPLSFEWIHVVPSSQENVTVTERFGVKIIQETENMSVLMMIVKTPEMYGQYICEAHDVSTGQKEQQTLMLIKGRRPPRIHLTPELILMTTASFKVEPLDENSQAEANTNTNASTDFDAQLSEAERNEKYGVELPFAGYIVWIKPACHLLGEWIPGNVTELDEGFRLNNLHPNEGYYVKAALKNTGGTGDFGEYWKIRTSSAVMLKSSDAVRIRAGGGIFVGNLTLAFVIATAGVLSLLSSSELERDC